MKFISERVAYAGVQQLDPVFVRVVARIEDHLQSRAQLRET